MRNQGLRPDIRWVDPGRVSEKSGIFEIEGAKSIVIDLARHGIDERQNREFRDTLRSRTRDVGLEPIVPRSSSECQDLRGVQRREGWQAARSPRPSALWSLRQAERADRDAPRKMTPQRGRQPASPLHQPREDPEELVGRTLQDAVYPMTWDQSLDVALLVPTRRDDRVSAPIIAVPPSLRKGPRPTHSEAPFRGSTLSRIRARSP